MGVRGGRPHRPPGGGIHIPRRKHIDVFSNVVGVREPVRVKYRIVRDGDGCAGSMVGSMIDVIPAVQVKMRVSRALRQRGLRRRGQRDGRGTLGNLLPHVLRALDHALTVDARIERVVPGGPVLAVDAVGAVEPDIVIISESHYQFVLRDKNCMLFDGR